MRRLLLMSAAMLIVLAACGGDDDAATTTTAAEADTAAVPDTTASPETTAAPETTATPETTTAPETAAPEGGGVLVIDEIDFAGDRVILRNAGDGPLDLTGHWICNRPSYAELPAEVLDPGATTEVAASVVGLGAGGGELGVYSSSDFGSADAMIRYVAWGSAGQGRQGTAVEAGLWGADDFVDNQGAGIVFSGDDPVSAAGWSAG